MTVQTRIKVCCISSVEEAWLAIEAGAAALGLVSRMPSGPGMISEQQIADIAATVPPPVATFLLTAHQHADSIIKQHKLCRTTTIQLVDDLPDQELIELRSAIGGTKLVQVIHVVGEHSVERAAQVAPLVDALLLDSGNQQLRIKELGGTGRTHDWELSRQIRDECGKPVFLAGGLTATNVSAAIAAVQPFGIDLCSSLRTNRRLDKQKLDAFFEAVRAGADRRWNCTT